MEARYILQGRILINKVVREFPDLSTEKQPKGKKVATTLHKIQSHCAKP